MLPVLADPTAWAGRVYSPPNPLDLATLQNTLVAQLQSAFSTTPISVFGYPDLPTDAWWAEQRRIGYVLVAYDATEYGLPLSTSAMVQERKTDFEILIIGRQISWADMSSAGVFQAIVKVAKTSLTGFRPTGWRNGYFTGEHYREKDPQGRIWVYAMKFRTITMEIEQPDTAVQAALALLKTLRFIDVSGDTAVAVPAASFAFSAGVIQLPNGNVSAVMVMNPSTGVPYILGSDYSVQRWPGTVTVIPGGALSATAAVNVAYSYSDVVTMSASGGSVPFYPSN